MIEGMGECELEDWRRALAGRYGLDYEAIKLKACKECSPREQKVKYGRPKKPQPKKEKVPRVLEDIRRVNETDQEEGEPARLGVLRQLRARSPVRFLERLEAAEREYRNLNGAVPLEVEPVAADLGTEKCLQLVEEMLLRWEPDQGNRTKDHGGL